MITFIKQNKLLVIIAVLFVCGVVYYALTSGGSSSSQLLTTGTTQAPDADSQQLLEVLANLKTIQLNGAIFQDPVFLSLSDFGVTIPLETPGRRDPFAPLVSGAFPSTNLSVPGSQ